MLQHKWIAMFTVALALLTCCGEKIDPASPDADTTNTGTSPVTDSNIATDSNTIDPNTANPNATTPSGGNTPTNGNTTTATGGNTTTPAPATSKLCGTNDTKISYATHIAPLVTTTCSNCHGGSGGFRPTMTTFANTKAAFTDSGAEDQIDSGAMPQGRTLTANQLCLYKTWVSTGFNP